MSFAVDGISSGLDTAAIIDSLMFAEGATSRRLAASKASEEGALNAWTDIDTRLDSVADSIKSIRTGDALISALATSSDESIARVTARSGALPGSYRFRVQSLASANQLVSSGLSGAAELVGAGTASVTGGFRGIGTEVSAHSLNAGTYTVNITALNNDATEATVMFDGIEQTVAIDPNGIFTLTAADGETLTLSAVAPEAVEGEGGGMLAVPAPTNGTIRKGKASITVIKADATTTVAGLAAALNARGGPVQAQLIDTGDRTSAPTRLVITAKATGLDGAANVDLSGLALFNDGMATLREASDAVVTLGNGGLAITRSSNSIADLFEGIDVDLIGTSEDTDVELTVSPDIDARVEAVKTVVDGVSDTLRQLNGYTKWNVETGKGGPLVGDFTGRQVARELASAMNTLTASGPFVLMSQIGVKFERDGTYSIDEAKLTAALTEDPDAVAAVLVGDPARDDDGVLDVLAKTVDRFGSKKGRISSAIQGRENNIRELDRLIASQDLRLEKVEARLKAQYTQMETLLGQLQNEGNYLASMLGAGQSR